VSTGALPVQAVAAALPIGLILLLMLGLRWSAARAGLCGLALAWLLALTVFGFGGATAADGATAPGPLAHHAGVLAEGVYLAAGILWILLPALALHEHQKACGAIDALRDGLGRVSGARPLQALLVGWCFALFLEGAAGFGTPIALVAPILVGLGVPAVQAVVLALVGHAAGVAFGALGTPVLAQAALTGTDAAAIAWRTALMNLLVGGVLMAFFVRTLAAAGVGSPGVGWAAWAAAAFLLPALAAAVLLGPELATLGAALASAALLVVAARRHPSVGAGPTGGALLRRALWPYLVLIALVLLTRSVPPVARLLDGVVLGWALPGGYSGSLKPLLHPGTLLFVAMVVGARLQRVPLRALGAPIAAAARRLLPVTVALLAMLCLSRLLLHADMVAALERAAVAGVGSAWPLLAPALGALGSFVTGSATASNVLFSTLQAQTAQSLGLPVAAVLAAQSLGAAIGNIVCPHNLVAGAATVGLAGREAELLRRTMWPCLLTLALAGGLTALFTAT